MSLFEKTKKLWQDSIFMKILLMWYLIDFLFSFIIWISTKEYELFLFNLVWGLTFWVIYEFLRPKFFVLTGFSMALIEETIVYYLGGGLQGKALSLIHDYINSLPVFLMLLLGWYFYQKKFFASITDLYFLAGLHGFFIEIILSNLYLNPLLVVLFGGTNFFIYGGIVIAGFNQENKEGLRRSSLFVKIIAWVFILLLIVFGGIIADILNKQLGY